MKFVGTKTLETERLILRKFTHGDARSIFNNWASDDAVTEHLSWPTHKNLETSEKVLKVTMDAYDESVYNWGIVLKADNELIGTIGVVNQEEANEQCEIGYCIGKAYWGKGITAEALKTVIKYLFEEAAFERIYSMYHADNPSSGRVMIKAGMQYEGKLRHHRKKTSGKYVDCEVYGIIKSDIE